MAEIKVVVVMINHGYECQCEGCDCSSGGACVVVVIVIVNVIAVAIVAMVEVVEVAIVGRVCLFDGIALCCCCCVLVYLDGCCLDGGRCTKARAAPADAGRTSGRARIVYRRLPAAAR